MAKHFTGPESMFHHWLHFLSNVEDKFCRQPEQQLSARINRPAAAHAAKRQKGDRFFKADCGEYNPLQRGTSGRKNNLPARYSVLHFLFRHLPDRLNFFARTSMYCNREYYRFYYHATARLPENEPRYSYAAASADQPVREQDRLPPLEDLTWPRLLSEINSFCKNPINALLSLCNSHDYCLLPMLYYAGDLLYVVDEHPLELSEPEAIRKKMTVILSEHNVTLTYAGKPYGIGYSSVRSFIRVEKKHSGLQQQEFDGRPCNSWKEAVRIPTVTLFLTAMAAIYFIIVRINAGIGASSQQFAFEQKGSYLDKEAMAGAYCLVQEIFMQEVFALWRESAGHRLFPSYRLFCLLMHDMVEANTLSMTRCPVCGSYYLPLRWHFLQEVDNPARHCAGCALRKLSTGHKSLRYFRKVLNLDLEQEAIMAAELERRRNRLMGQI